MRLLRYLTVCFCAHAMQAEKLWRAWHFYGPVAVVVAAAAAAAAAVAVAVAVVVVVVVAGAAAAAAAAVVVVKPEPQLLMRTSLVRPLTSPRARA